MRKVQEIVKSREAWHATVCGGLRAGHDLGTEQQQNWYILQYVETLQTSYEIKEVSQKTPHIL